MYVSDVDICQVIRLRCLLAVVVVALTSLLMARAVQVGWSSGAIQEMMLQGCWHVHRRLQEYVKRFTYSILHVYVTILALSFEG